LATNTDPKSKTEPKTMAMKLFLSNNARSIRPSMASRLAFSTSNPNHPFDDTHLQLQKSIIQYIEKEVNPHVDEWEKAGIFYY
jgi:hypothetical protein